MEIPEWSASCYLKQKGYPTGSSGNGASMFNDVDCI